MEKFTRTYALIHVDAVVQNIENVYRQVGADVKIMAIVKANAYGHGAVKLATLIQDKVYGFAVATVNEALELRESGIDNMILVLGYVTHAEYDSMIKNKITFAILSEDMGIAIDERAKALGMKALCHIKVNTGMNRIGFFTDDSAVDEIERVCRLNNLSCDGIFMHFATADMKDKTYSRQQFDLFTKVTEELSGRGISFAIKHCANSAAIIDMPEYAMDMVREGIILYGLRPSDEVNADYPLCPVMEIKSHVIFVKELSAGCSVSYGRTYVTSAATKVATVAIGYADGYPRSLSSKGYVLIRGRKAPVIGRVCMDQMMVDVTDIPDVQVEDVVTIVGKDGDMEITVDDLSEISGKFNYEFVCGISDRVERKYIP